jgi:hypothetical protein
VVKCELAKRGKRGCILISVHQLMNQKCRHFLNIFCYEPNGPLATYLASRLISRPKALDPVRRPALSGLPYPVVISSKILSSVPAGMILKNTRGMKDKIYVI